MDDGKVRDLVKMISEVVVQKAGNFARYVRVYQDGERQLTTLSQWEVLK